MREMKNSGIEWVGTIPSNWMVMPNKRIMHKQKVLCDKYNGEDILSLTMNGVIVRNLDAGGKVPATFDGYQIVCPNNLLMCLFDYDVTPRCIGLIKNNGLTSPAYSQFVVDNGNIPSYYYYYYLMIDNTKELLHLAKNLRHSFTEEQLGEIYVPVPPINEQEKIANFLDDKIDEIDNAIIKTKETIEDYKKYKKSVINKIVTKGLDRNVELIDSKIDEIGFIPKNWKLNKIKYIVDSLTKGTGITKEEVVEDGDIQCVRYGEIYTKYETAFSDTCSRTNMILNPTPRYINYGDILFAVTGELVEEIGKNIVYLGKEKCLVGGDIIVASHSQSPRFMNYAFNSISSQMQKSNGKAKLKVVHISSSEIGNIRVAYPNKTEQEEIADYLDSFVNEVNKVIKCKEKIIEQLENYKKSVIYEYVTGKKEVK